MNAPFQPDAPLRPHEGASLVDPDEYDASEQKFAASLENPGPQWLKNHSTAVTKQHNDTTPGQNPELVSAALGAGPPAADSGADPDAWRQQVADKLNKYRARRQPRAPRYPSLQLKFEAGDPSWDVISPAASSHLILDGSAAAAQLAHQGWPADAPSFQDPDQVQDPGQAPGIAPATDNSRRVIPFRRSTSAPPKPLEELAEPLHLFPRILEVPEVAPPPPALGGILIEPVAEETNPKRPGIDLPLQTSPVSRRFLAAALDGIVVVAALALFGYIFMQITGTTPPLRQLLAMGSMVLAFLWAGYQYLLLTYVGSTPGLKLARLRLSRFDGLPVAEPMRRWRVLASFLSAISLGLGYAWCILDEDQLCWHDRITHTHLAPKE